MDKSFRQPRISPLHLSYFSQKWKALLRCGNRIKSGASFVSREFHFKIQGRRSVQVPENKTKKINNQKI